MIRLIAVFLLFGFGVNAQTLPQLYDVAGVASDDVLNVRGQPSSASEIVETLAPNATNVEVIRIEDNWGYIGMGEISGWVSMNFLSANPTTDGKVPNPLTCFGTEPFWQVALMERGNSYSTPGNGNSDLVVLAQGAASNGFIVELTDEKTSHHTLVINALNCNDGMSDREFGMSAILFSISEDDNSVQNGCCTFQQN